MQAINVGDVEVTVEFEDSINAQDRQSQAYKVKHCVDQLLHPPFLPNYLEGHQSCLYKTTLQHIRDKIPLQVKESNDLVQDAH